MFIFCNTAVPLTKNNGNARESLVVTIQILSVVPREPKLAFNHLGTLFESLYFQIDLDISFSVMVGDILFPTDIKCELSGHPHC